MVAGQVCKKCGIPKLKYVRMDGNSVRLCPLCNDIRNIKFSIKREQEAYKQKLASLKYQMKQAKAQWAEDKADFQRFIQEKQNMTQAEKQAYYDAQVLNRAEMQAQFDREKKQ